MNGRKVALSITDPADVGGALNEFRELIERAKSAFPLGHPVRGGIRPGPVADLVPLYLDAKAREDVSPKTVYAYKVLLKNLMALNGNSAIEDLDAETIEFGAKSRGWSDSNRHNYLFCVQAFVRWCGRKDFALRRPAKESRGADAFIDDKTAAAIFRETTGDFHQLLRFLWLTGCRPMEAAKLTVESVDTVNGTIKLKQHKTKHKGKQRLIYPGPQALALIREQVERHKTGPLFRGMRGKAFSIQAIVTRFIRLSEKMQRPVTAYHFRHTFATRALMSGVPDVQVAALMGHASTTMIHKNYSHVNQQAGMLLGTSAKIEESLPGQ